METLLKADMPLGGNWSILWLKGLLKQWNEPQATPEMVLGCTKLANCPTQGQDFLLEQANVCHVYWHLVTT